MLVLSLHFSLVQTFLSNQITSFLAKELHAKISLERVYFKPFNRLELENIAIIEQNGDTTLYAKKIDASVDLLQFFNNKITVNKIQSHQAYLNFQIYADSTNFTKYAKYFTTEKKQKVNTNKKLEFSLNAIELFENRFRMVNHKYTYPKKGVNFANLYLTDISGTINQIDLDSIISADIHKLTLKEKSGFHLREFTSHISYHQQEMNFDKLLIRTNHSIFKDHIQFKYQKIGDFSDFINKVQVKANISNSYIDSKDIEFFAPSLQYVQFNTHITSASLQGTVKDIQARNVVMNTGNNTRLTSDFTIKGLPFINKTIFGFNIKELKTSPEDIERIVPKLTQNKKIKLPTEIHNLKDLQYKGSLLGLYNDFQLKGDLLTHPGLLYTDAHIKLKKDIEYEGKISSSDFLISQVLHLRDIQKTNFDINLSGKGITLENLNLSFDGTINEIQTPKYTYHNIKASGNILEKLLWLEGNIDDQNLKLSYNSSVDWNKNSPSYNLNAEINHAAITQLGWTKKDSIYLHHAHINTNLIGDQINNIEGELYADSISFSTSKGDFSIPTVNLIAKGNEQNRSLNIKSDVLDLDMSGVIDLNTIVPYFKSLAIRYAPAINLDLEEYNAQNFNLNIHIKSFNPIAALLGPTLFLDDGANLKAQFSSEEYTAKFKAYSPSILYKGIKINNLNIEENADQNAFSLNVSADRVSFTDSTYINKVVINNTLANDSLVFNMQLSEKNANNYLNLNGDIHFAQNAPAYIHLKPSYIIINKETWSVNDDAKMLISQGKIYVNNLIINQNKQQVQLNGILSNQKDKLNILFNNFNLTSLNGITKPLGVQLEGMLDGSIDLTSVFKNPIASANIKTSPITYNQVQVGTLALDAQFNPNNGNILIDLNLLDELKRGILLTGEYNFYNDNEPLDLKGTLKETNLTIFQPFLKNLVSNLKGKSDADVTIKGTFKNPKITGVGNFYNAEFTVNYLNTHYIVDNEIALVQNNAILLQDLTLRDINGNTAKANGLINLQKLANPYIDVDLNANKFLILNTSLKQNDLYYGTAYASGNFKFKGYTSAINIDIDAISQSGTNITLPFNTAMTISDNDFIYFVTPDSLETDNKKERNSFNGLTMNMNLNFTSDAQVNLQTTMGSLKGNGNGNITMKISNLGDFEMFGDYIISEGKFHFTAQDFFNKYFDIKQGGTIRWTGNPSEAVINLNAVYQQRTAIGPLFNAAGSSGENERVLAQADMLIKGTLEQPDITFDLNFPQNPYIKDQLQSYLSDANNVNQQALSLIVRRSFTPSSINELGREVNNTLLSAGTEIAFNQLNNIISESLNINFLDLNIRSFNDASASLRLLNDRLVLSGGITDRTNYDATDLTFFRQGITTDAELTYKLRQDGNLLFRAYNRPYTRNFLIRSMDSEYITALGLVYRQEFNSFLEFWQKLWFIRAKKENKK